MSRAEVTALKEKRTMADDPVIAQKGPFQVELAAGKAYFYCRC